MGKPHIYCIGEIDDSGLVRFNDWGYPTEAEARETLGSLQQHRQLET